MNFSHDQNSDCNCSKKLKQASDFFEDGVALFATDDLPALGKLADSVRRRKARPHHLFQCKPPFQPHQCLLRRLQVLRVLSHAATAGCLHA